MELKNLFTTVLNMTVTGSIITGVVLLARLALGKAPKVFSYALWAVVLFRLLCPVSVSFDFSVLGVVDSPVAAVSENASRMEYVPENFVYVEPGEAGTSAEISGTEPAESGLRWEDILPTIWLAGVGAMSACSVWSMLRLKRKTAEAVRLHGNVYEADGLGTAFVMGLVRPGIYLPSGLGEQERQFILLHEEHHLKRRDHLAKLVSYAALCIHWFNPLVWLAFRLAERDMEMSCDEAVLAKLGVESRCDYSQTLLRVSSGRRHAAAMPLAFGEGNTKGRVKNVLNWKKPKMWVSLICGVLCVTILAACAVNPAVETTVPTGTAPLVQTEPVPASDLEQSSLTDLERAQRELEQLRAEYERLRAMGQAVRVDLTEYANIEIVLPEGWAYEVEEYTDGCYRCGIRFWRADDPEGQIGLYYFPDGFGVCGTGLETVDLPMENGTVVSVGYYDGSDDWSFASFGNDYAACAENNVESWPDEDWQTALNIVLSAKLNQGVVSQAEALARLENAGLLEPEWQVYRAEFDIAEGFWTITFYEGSYSNLVRTLCVGWDGSCAQPDDTHHDHSDHHE